MKGLKRRQHKVDLRAENQRRQGEVWALGTRIVMIQWGLIALAGLDVALHLLNFLTR